MKQKSEVLKSAKVCAKFFFRFFRKKCTKMIARCSFRGSPEWTFCGAFSSREGARAAPPLAFFLKFSTWMGGRAGRARLSVFLLTIFFRFFSKKNKQKLESAQNTSLRKGFHCIFCEKNEKMKQKTEVFAILKRAKVCAFFSFFFEIEKNIQKRLRNVHSGQIKIWFENLKSKK